MSRTTHILTSLTAVVATLPSVADALTFVQVLSMFHVMTGLLLTFVLLMFVTGIWAYFARLGTWPTHRDNAIKILEMGVSLLAVLVVRLALLRAFQVCTTVMLTILAVVVFLVLAFFIVRSAATRKEKPAARPGARPAGPPAGRPGGK